MKNAKIEAIQRQIFGKKSDVYELRNQGFGWSVLEHQRLRAVRSSRYKFRRVGL